MSDPVFATFYRKALSLAEIKSTRWGYDGGTCEVRIVETKEMTATEYDDFVSDFMVAHTWLDGKGGSSLRKKGDTTEEIHHCIAITAPDRETIYVNPHGHSYARYVGVQAANPLTVKYPDISVQLVGKDSNAFNILGLCKRAAKKSGRAEDEIKSFLDEATAGDYNHLLATCQRWFDCY